MIEDMFIQVGGSQEIQCEQCGSSYAPAKEFHVCPENGKRMTDLIEKANNFIYEKLDPNKDYVVRWGDVSPQLMASFASMVSADKDTAIDEALKFFAVTSSDCTELVEKGNPNPKCKYCAIITRLREVKRES